ncbi:hypothetical protein [Pseudothauera rhizosphaerae]|uniref:Uncharacterized protein n=1 Tax=Pseudothauera rhizosphaerae TaxID=2565932 RepID=A0A4S4AN17_9RHOO|nr:hypothetical protein [Pseudothauera rhizosphaerae]THF60938.1 hypothetical protein E6O51_11965 [Pseudothauera rhizosphaerae]
MNADIVIPLAAHRPPRVLNADTLDRLSRLNATVRKLRSWGATVLDEELVGRWPVAGHTAVRIARPSGNLLRVLTASVHGCTRITGAHGVYVLLVLDGVRLVWLEGQS